MAFGSFLSGFGDGFIDGLLGADYIKDYKHASKIFTGDNYANAPQTKFLFHVYFTLNTGEIEGLHRVMGSLLENSTIGVLVKSADLPSYDIELKDYNQYNRKRYVQTGIKYRPINLTLHDDGSDLVRSMWYNYMTYYYSDSTHYYNGKYSQGNSTKSNINRRDIYDAGKTVNDWGLNGDNANGAYKPPFFKDIKIYGFNRGNYVEYTLVNPMIESWKHDTFDYSAADGIMEHQMTVKYEMVKYQRCNVDLSKQAVDGFANQAHYDLEPSPLSKPGSTTSIFGQAGLLDSGSSIVEDLVPGGDGNINILRAALTAGRTAKTFKNADLGQIFKAEGTGVLGGVATTALNSKLVTGALQGMVFSKDSDSNSSQIPRGSTQTDSNNGNTTATNPTSRRTTPQRTNQQGSTTDVNSNGSNI